MILLKHAKRLLPTNELVDCEVLIDYGKIAEIKQEITSEPEQIIDCKGRLLLPGFIDVHVHLREPGGEHKETIETGTMAAARGGFTTVCAMPNTKPVPDNLETFNQLQEKIEQDAVIRVLPYAAITKGLKGDILTPINELAELGTFAFTDDGVGIQTADQMLRAMREAAACGKPIVAHCEDNSLVYQGVVHDGEVSERLQLPGIPSLSESVQIARDVLLAETTGCHYHVCHVSTKESVRVIRDAKKASIPVTAEVTPHHLLLNETDIPANDANFKMNPPLRSKEDQQALIDGLLDGTIDLIATDHAPHAADEKANGFLQAPFGIVGLETAFSLLYSKLVKTQKCTLSQLVDWLTFKPAQTFGLPYGRLEAGRIADLTLVDLDAERQINRNHFYSQGKNTPFHGWHVTGLPVMTIAAGKIAYKEDDHVETSTGTGR
ncbi:dihydroorotase [Lentibacillus sp. L22]|uniref:dihydroorotase n=1 Tax=Lentibacillus TaxID=175304 RepID=UPI0022B1DEE4|nr:dihydroorotase [Lentibacillus daqui]